MRFIYLGKCVECGCSMYWNEEEEKLVGTSDLPDHQCSLREEKEEKKNEET